jgi:hypothetical protein
MVLLLVFYHFNSEDLSFCNKLCLCDHVNVLSARGVCSVAFIIKNILLLKQGSTIAQALIARLALGRVSLRAFQFSLVIGYHATNAEYSSVVSGWYGRLQ